MRDKILSLDKFLLLGSALLILTLVVGIIVLVLKFGCSTAVQVFYRDNWQDITRMTLVWLAILTLPILILYSCLLGFVEFPAMIILLLVLCKLESVLLEDFPRTLSSPAYGYVENQDIVISCDDLGMLTDAKLNQFKSLKNEIDRLHEDRIIIIGAFTGHEDEFKANNFMTPRRRKLLKSIREKSLPPEEQKIWENELELSRDQFYSQ